MTNHYSTLKNHDLKNDFNNKLLSALDIFSQQLNKIFLKVNTKVSDMILKNTGKHSRVNKLTFNDAVCYLYDYCFFGNTKSKVVANLNYTNNLDVSDSNYQKKRSKYSIVMEV